MGGLYRIPEIKMNDPLKPKLDVLIKLGSIAVHVDEAISLKGHAFDVIALEGLLKDKDIINWIKEMDKMALLPKKR